jgi:hypothetical protein
MRVVWSKRAAAPRPSFRVLPSRPAPAGGRWPWWSPRDSLLVVAPLLVSSVDSDAALVPSSPPPATFLLHRTQACMHGIVTIEHDDTDRAIGCGYTHEGRGLNAHCLVVCNDAQLQCNDTTKRCLPPSFRKKTTTSFASFFGLIWMYAYFNLCVLKWIGIKLGLIPFQSTLTHVN